MAEGVRAWSIPMTVANTGTPHTCMAPRADIHGKVDVGHSCSGESDHFLITDLERSTLLHRSQAWTRTRTRDSGGGPDKILAVASGMPGFDSSRTTFMATMESIARYVLSTLWWAIDGQPADGDHRPEPQRVLDELTNVLPRCCLQLKRLAMERGSEAPFDSTITLAYVVWPDMYVVHAGSSRCYLARAGALRQITIQRAPLGSAWSYADVHHVPLQRGDRVLLCTEGLTRHASDRDMAARLTSRMSVSQSCKHLIDAARRAGSTDSMAVVLASFV